MPTEIVPFGITILVYLFAEAIAKISVIALSSGFSTSVFSSVQVINLNALSQSPLRVLNEILKSLQEYATFSKSNLT